MMHACTLHCLGRKRQREGAAVIIGVPLVVEVLVEDVAGLAIDDVERAGVQVREVNGKPLGRPEVRCHLLDGLGVAGERQAPRPGAFFQDRDVAPEGMGDVGAMHPSPPPYRDRAGRAGVVDRVLDRGGQQTIVAGIARRQPALRLMGQHVFQPHRPHERFVLFPLVAQLRLQQKLFQFVAREDCYRRGCGIGTHAAIPLAHQIGGFSSARRCLWRMIDRVDESLGAEAIERRDDVGLDRQHVSRRKFLVRGQQLVQTLRAIR